MKKDFLTDREIHVVGIQRTGQHAITSWLIGHFENVCYRNCMSQLGERKGRTRGITPPFWYFESGKGEDWEVCESNIIKGGQDAIILGTEFTLNTGCIGLNPNLEREKAKMVDRSGHESFSKRQDYLIVIRNPYNQYSSIINWPKNRRLSKPQNFSTLWKSFARECVGETDHLPGPKRCVIYDNWFSSVDYRKDISDYLSVNHSDKRLNTVMKIGGGKDWGSSFDSMKRKNSAQSMKVLDRWKSSSGDERFLELLKDEELEDLANQLGFNKPSVGGGFEKSVC